MLEKQRQEETQRRREHNLWQEKARMAEMEAQKLRRAEWESKQREAQIAEQKRLEAEKAEAEEKRQEMLKMAQCEIWENKFTDVLSDLQPLKLKHQVIIPIVFFWGIICQCAKLKLKNCAVSFHTSVKT